MRRWVEYNYPEDRVVSLDKSRLLKCAKVFSAACEKYKGAYGVSAVEKYYKTYLSAALKCEIGDPQVNLPYTDAMRDRLLPEELEKALMSFSWALQSKPAIYNYLDSDTFYNHRDKYIKEEDGKYYIYELFDE